MDWEYTLRRWSKPSSDTEQEKCANAESAIRKAISESDDLSGLTITVRAHGSYRNNTNVSQESDVDIYVCCYDVCFTDFSLADGFAEQDVALGPGAFPYAAFKNSVENALVAKFGRAQVTRGDRAFDVHENSYRVDADVVAAIEHRRYPR
jgi:hypothetical protein